MKKIYLIILILAVFTQTGCWVTATEGTVQVQTVWDKMTKIIRAEDGGIWSITTMGDDYYSVSLLSQTAETDVTATSKDNAALTIKIAVTYHLKNSDESIERHLRRFGLPEKMRNEQYTRVLLGQLNTETKNAIAEYDAYGILANQEAIQKRITEAMRPILENQLDQELESVQIIGRPDFVDDRIEQAASQVVANQKLKEAAQAGLEAAKVNAEQKQVEAQTYANPALLQIRKLELQVEIADKWRQHQGTLIFGGQSPVQTIGVDK